MYSEKEYEYKHDYASLIYKLRMVILVFFKSVLVRTLLQGIFINHTGIDLLELIIIRV